MRYARWSTSSLDRFLMVVGALTLLIGIPVGAWRWYDSAHPCVKRGPGKCSDVMIVGDVQVWTQHDCEVCVERK